MATTTGDTAGGDEEASARHRDQVSNMERQLIEENTSLTRQVKELTEHVDALTRTIHARVVES